MALNRGALCARRCGSGLAVMLRIASRRTARRRAEDCERRCGRRWRRSTRSTRARKALRMLRACRSAQASMLSWSVIETSGLSPRALADLAALQLMRGDWDGAGGAKRCDCTGRLSPPFAVPAFEVVKQRFYGSNLCPARAGQNPCLRANEGCGYEAKRRCCIREWGLTPATRSGSIGRRCDLVEAFA